MKETRNFLMMVFVGALVLTGLIVLVYETGVLESGAMAEKKEIEFITLTTMEIMTLASIYLALRFFKMEKIRQGHSRSERGRLEEMGTPPDGTAGCPPDSQYPFL